MDNVAVFKAFCGRSAEINQEVHLIIWNALAFAQRSTAKFNEAIAGKVR
jgi:hypothetical protein